MAESLSQGEADKEAYWTVLLDILIIAKYIGKQWETTPTNIAEWVDVRIDGGVHPNNEEQSQLNDLSYWKMMTISEIL